MKSFFKKNEAEVFTSIGFLLILHHFLSNGFKFSGYPTGAFIFGLGAYMLIRKYYFKKSD